MKKCRRLLSVTMALTLALMLACGGFVTARASGDTITLTLFTHYSEDNNKIATDYAIEALKEQFPNVEVAIDVMPNDNDEKIKTLAATGDLPDIIDINASLINLFTKSDLLLPLDPYIEQTGVASQFMESAQAMFYQIDGKTYALPNAPKDIIAIYYNKELFAQNGVKVPTNYDEFKAAVVAFQDKGITPLSLFAQQQWPGFSFYDALVATQEPGGVKRIDAGQGDFSEPAYVNAANKLVDLINAGLISKSAFNMGYDEAIATFLDGKSAMFQNGTWDAKNIGDQMGDNAGILYLTALADPADTESSKWNVVGGGFGNGFAVSATASNKDIAGQYAVALSAKITEGYVVKRSAINSMLVGEFTPDQPFNSLQQELADNYKNFSSGTSFWWALTNATFSTAVGENVAKLMTGDYSPDSFIADMNAVVEEVRSGE